MSKNRNLANLIASSNNPIADIVASAPGALDTLNELASALGNDASFATTITNSLASKASASTLSEFYAKGTPTFTFNYSIDNPNAYGTADNDGFGSPLAISGDLAVISAKSEDDAGGTQSGKVYIYNIATNTLVQTISNPTGYSTSANDYFGTAVAINGNTVIVGADQEGDTSGTLSGKAYMFNATTGSLIRTLDNPSPVGTGSWDRFGTAVAFSGDGTYTYVSAPYEEYDGSTSDSGKVYVYNTSTGSLVYTIDNPNGYSTRVGDAFGWTLAANGSYLAVNAINEDDASNSGAGKVYVFSVTGSGVQLLYTLNNPNPVATATADQFGRALTMSSTRLVVGSREQSGAYTASGYAYVYNLETGALLYSIANPNAYDTPSNDQFGESLGIAGDLLIIGARGETDPTSSSYVGKVYVYNINTGSLLSTINDPNKYGSTHSDTFGNAIAASGSHVLISATTEGAVSGSGVVYKYTSATPITLSASSITATNNLQLPVGTTAQRPGTPTVGMTRFNTDINSVEAYHSTKGWIALSNTFSASGGIESTYTSNNTLYKIHVFTSSSTWTSNSVGTVEALIVAGGGGGGSAAGGGGGGVIYNTSVSVVAGPYNIVVGAGGSASPSNSTGGQGGDGNNSSAFNLTAIGGGGGGAYNGSSSVWNGRSGGSGGGGGWNSSLPTGGSGTSGQGFAGGSGDTTGSPWTAGGGGGANAVGGNAQTWAGGAGGAGILNNILNTSYYWGGGGGGGGQSDRSTNTPGGVGGIGGGGGGGSTYNPGSTPSTVNNAAGGAGYNNGGTGTASGNDGAYSNSTGGSGGANTGGGGGGQGISVGASGAGGSGIVIIRYVL